MKRLPVQLQKKPIAFIRSIMIHFILMKLPEKLTLKNIHIEPDTATIKNEKLEDLPYVLIRYQNSFSQGKRCKN